MTFLQLPSTFHAANRTFRQLPSTLHVDTRPSFNLYTLSVHQRDFPSAYCAAGRSYVNFCQLSERLRKLPSTSVNFIAARRPYSNFRQLFVRPGDFPLTSVNFPCSRETFRQLPSTSCATRRPSSAGIPFCSKVNGS